MKADKVFVPSESLALSARILHEYFGEDELDRVIGGKTWWQRRLTPDGAVPAEWIEVPGTNDGGRTMLYIHGGAGFFGSINTHRCVSFDPVASALWDSSSPDLTDTPSYTLWRYARKIRGRVFAARYRLAPQCASRTCGSPHARRPVPMSDPGRPGVRERVLGLY